MARPLVLCTAKEAAAHLRVNMYAVRKIELQRLLVPCRLPAGHRRHGLDMLGEYRERTRVPTPSSPQCAGILTFL
jgi:hypothetical protein